jgi:hypothetical protein
MTGDDLPSNTQLGRYLLTSRLGQGGMGAVYAGEDLSLKRAVAVKVLGDSCARASQDLDRFILEARAAARLNHPNVVTVHDVGQREGMAYIVMELMPRGSAQGRLRDKGAFPWPEATRIIRDVCRGLASAHAAGLIHRDIKPSNILLTADGTAKLADFGLAKAPILAPTRLTRVGDILGTPHYMSPEHCAGEPLDERTDLYSLGATYYALLVGRPPFDAADPMQVLYAQCSAPVPDPRALVPNLPPGCVAIVTRALAKQRRDRFRTAQEMASALDSCLTAVPVSPEIPVAMLAAKPGPIRPPAEAATMLAEPILARPAKPAGTRLPWWSLALAALAALGLVIVVMLSAAFFLFGNRFQTPPETPNAKGPTRSGAAAGKAGPGIVLKRRLSPLKGHVGAVRSVSAGADLLASGGEDGTARIWSADGGRLLHTLKHPDGLDAVALSPDGNLLACGGKGKAVFLWNPRTGKDLGRLDDGIHSQITALAFAPSGKQLAVATQAELVVFDGAPPKYRRAASLLQSQYVVSAVAYSSDGKQLAACSYSKSICRWDVATWSKTQAPGNLPSWTEAVALSPDGSRVMFGTRDGEFYSWEPPQPPRLLGTTPPSITALACVPGRDAFLLAGEWGGPLRLCEPAAGGKVETFAGAPKDIPSVCFAPGGTLVAAACTDGCVYLWDVRTARGLEK